MTIEIYALSVKEMSKWWTYVCVHSIAHESWAYRCSVCCDVSYLAAESPGCELCRQSCDLCSYWTSHWSPSRPERDRWHSQFNLKHRTAAKMLLSDNIDLIVHRCIEKHVLSIHPLSRLLASTLENYRPALSFTLCVPFTFIISKMLYSSFFFFIASGQPTTAWDIHKQYLTIDFFTWELRKG